MSEQEKTADKIKETARILFLKKGFNGVTTREIAEEAGINSALLNYYFRSKEKLFRIIMTESVQQMFHFLRMNLNDTTTSLMQKMNGILNGYIDTISKNPNLPIFVFNELHSNPQLLFKEAGIPQNLIYESYLYKQIADQIEAKKIKIRPEHFFVNFISLTVLPLIAKPMLQYIYFTKMEDIDSLLEERRTLITLWMKQMLEIED